MSSPVTEGDRSLYPFPAIPLELPRLLESLVCEPGDPPARWYLDELGAGRCELLAYYEHGSPAAYLVVRDEQGADGPELVVVGWVAQSRRPHAELTRHALPLLLAHAELRGARTIRCHTRRAGLIETLCRAGWHVAETVLRAPVPRGGAG